MTFSELSIPGVFEITLEQKRDERGFFMRLYDEKTFVARGLPTDWVQESRAFSAQKGTIRGLHFLYPPRNESKLITMVSGEGYWVFVDIRKNSPTIGRWGSVVLSGDKPSALLIPRGFANGVCTLSDNCDVIYRMDNAYDDAAKGEFRYDDRDLNIPWPVTPPTVLSERDEKAPSFAEFLRASGGGLEL